VEEGKAKQKARKMTRSKNQDEFIDLRKSWPRRASPEHELEHDIASREAPSDTLEDGESNDVKGAIIHYPRNVTRKA
jgi:hypothetical protein